MIKTLLQMLAQAGCTVHLSELDSSIIILRNSRGEDLLSTSSEAELVGFVHGYLTAMHA